MADLGAKSQDRFSADAEQPQPVRSTKTAEALTGGAATPAAAPQK
jgi:hypothetical protein